MIAHTEEFELYHYGESLCSQMVRLTLAEKQIAYKSHHMYLELTGENLSRAFKKINPNVVVPVLVHNGTPIYNSSDIIRYLDNHAPAQGAALLPTSAEGLAALDDQVMENALRNDIPLGDNFGTSIAGASTYILANILKRRPALAVMWDYLIKHPDPVRKFAFCVLRLRLADGRDYLFGDYTMLDIMMTAHLHRIEDVHLDTILSEQKLPHLAAYWQRVRARPSYQAAMTDHHSWEWRAAMDAVYQGEPSPFLPLLESALDAQLSAQDKGRLAA
jgi:glutathione S-transferase